MYLYNYVCTYRVVAGVHVTGTLLAHPPVDWGRIINLFLSHLRLVRFVSLPISTATECAEGRGGEGRGGEGRGGEGRGGRGRKGRGQEAIKSA